MKVVDCQSSDKTVYDSWQLFVCSFLWQSVWIGTPFPHLKKMYSFIPLKVYPEQRKNRLIRSFIRLFIHSSIHSINHSFVHWLIDWLLDCLIDWFITSSRKVLRGAPYSSTVKKNSFQLNIECVRKCHSLGRRSFHTVGYTTQRAPISRPTPSPLTFAKFSLSSKPALPSHPPVSVFLDPRSFLILYSPT